MFKKLNNTHKLFTKYGQVNKLFNKNSVHSTNPYINNNTNHNEKNKYKNSLEK